MTHRWGISENSCKLFFGTPKSLQMVTAAMKLKDAYSLSNQLNWTELNLLRRGTSGLKLNMQKTKIMASVPITSWQVDGERMVTDRLFWGSPKSLQMVAAAMKLKDTCSWKKSYDQPRQHTKKQRYYFVNKGLSGKSLVFPVVMYGCESWTIKKAEHFWTVVLEKTLESPLDCKEIQPVHLKGNQSWIFIGRTDGEAETPVLWPIHLIWKTHSLEKTLMLEKL